MSDFLTECLHSFIPGCGGVRGNDGRLTAIGQQVSLRGAKHLISGVEKLVETLGIALPAVTHAASNADCALAAELRHLFNSCGSDKCVSHNYQFVYADVFKQLDRVGKLNLLEVGLGTQNKNLASHMYTIFSPCASLRALREFFPEAQIFGADIDRDILMQEERIKTAYVDQLDFHTFASMQAELGNPAYDLVIEDGLHSITASLNTLVFALQHTKENGFIVLEDLTDQQGFWRMAAGLLNFCGHAAKLIESNGLCLVLQKKAKLDAS